MSAQFRLVPVRFVLCDSWHDAVKLSGLKIKWILPCFREMFCVGCICSSDLCLIKCSLLGSNSKLKSIWAPLRFTICSVFRLTLPICSVPTSNSFWRGSTSSTRMWVPDPVRPTSRFVRPLSSNISFSLYVLHSRGIKVTFAEAVFPGPSIICLKSNWKDELANSDKHATLRSLVPLLLRVSVVVLSFMPAL